MSIFVKIINTLNYTSNKPEFLGVFHLILLAVLFISTLTACLLLKNSKQKTFKIFTFVCWISLILLEIYKQLMYSFSVSNEKVVWNYEWNIFPFQLSTVSLYLLPFVIFLKDGKVRDAITSFLIFFCSLVGIASLIYPENTFGSILSLNIQAMLQNGILVVLGILFAVYNRKKLNLKYFLSSLIVFVCVFAVATSLNFTFPLFIKDDTFNMLYISHKYNNAPAILSSLPYPICLLIYIVTINLSAFLFFLIIYTISILLNKERLKSANKPKLITSLIFVFVELTLLIISLFFNQTITKYLNAAGIALAALIPIIFIYPNKNIFYINIGLILTAVALIAFTLLNPTNNLLGMILCIAVQIFYFVFLMVNTKSKSNRLSNVIVRLVLTLGAVIASYIVFKTKFNILFLLSVICFANLFVNTVFAFAGGKNSVAFAIGLTIFTICNTIYILQDITSTYLIFNIQNISFTSFDIAWLLFVTAQIILATFVIYSKKSTPVYDASSLANIDFLDSVKNEFNANKGNTTIINTSSPSVKITKKTNGKTTNEINITTNNIPVEIKKENSNQKKTKTTQSKEKPLIKTKEKKSKISDTESLKNDIETEKRKTAIKNKIRKFDTFRND